MIKKTLHFGNPAFLSLENRQLVIRLDQAGTTDRKKITVPIEDIGTIVLDHPQITITHAVISQLLNNNVALITSGPNRLPTGMLLPLVGHTSQSERFKHQINATLPLKKNLWQQTVQAKILNQAELLASLDIPVENMRYWASCVKSGDNENHEARAAAFFWSKLFPESLNFIRGRYEAPPNNLLNYGYAVLRAQVARCLVASGMLPTLGIHHKNKYNAYCLADDIMEPYRPYVDLAVLRIVKQSEDISELTTSYKAELLKVLQADVYIDNQTSPLAVAVQRTTASLFRCFEGGQRKILYPEFR